MSKHTTSIYSEPSDQQLSQRLGGTRVISFRPEDIIYFSPDIRDNVEPWMQDCRLMDLFNRVKNAYPLYDQPPEGLHTLSATLSAAVYTLSKTTCYSIGTPYESYESVVDLFVLMRPSLQIDSALRLANASRIDPTLIVNALDIEKVRYLDTWHEFGHMHADLHNIEMPNPYYDELLADCTALRQAQEINDEHIIKPYILQRALTGFFFQPAQYWLAPQLAQIFAEQSNDETKATLEVDLSLKSRIWASYAELRLRTAADIGLNDKLDLYSSLKLQTALQIWDQDDADNIPDARLRQYCQILDQVRNDRNFYTRTGDILQSLARIVALPRLDPLTRECGEQILEAGRMYCPRIAPRP